MVSRRFDPGKVDRSRMADGSMVTVFSKWYYIGSNGLLDQWSLPFA